MIKGSNATKLYTVSENYLSTQNAFSFLTSLIDTFFFFECFQIYYF